MHFITFGQRQQKKTRQRSETDYKCSYTTIVALIFGLIKIIRRRTTNILTESKTHQFFITLLLLGSCKKLTSK